MDMNRILLGDAAQVLANLPKNTIDLIMTDSPYLVNYKDRSGRKLRNDDNPDGVLPVFVPIARAMRRDSYAVCFAGWSALPQFSAAWQSAGLRIVGQFVWAKPYASRDGFAQCRHKTAYLLAKGRPAMPLKPLPSVMRWTYSGNRNHPTEKAMQVLTPLIRCFSQQGDLVCDPFNGSGSTSVAAVLSGHRH